MTTNKNQKTIFYIIGGAAGLLTGLAAAFLLIKEQEKMPEQKSIITTKSGLKIGMGLATLLKQIADLGKIK